MTKLPSNKIGDQDLSFTDTCQVCDDMSSVLCFKVLTYTQNAILVGASARGPAYSWPAAILDLVSPEVGPFDPPSPKTLP